MAPIVKMHTLGADFIPEPIHAGGLRYHGMSPLVSLLKEHGLIEARSVHQRASFEAGVQFARAEGILPAPEPTHAIKVAIDEALAAKEAGEARVILFNLCGHGHFDLASYERYLDGTLEDYEYPPRRSRPRSPACRPSEPSPLHRTRRSCMPKLACWSCGRQIYTVVAARVAVRRGAPLPALRRLPRHGAARRRAPLAQPAPEPAGRPGPAGRRASAGSRTGGPGGAEAASVLRRAGDGAGSRRPRCGCDTRGMRVAFLGFGLIGGSIARALRAPTAPATVRLVGLDAVGRRAAARPCADGVIDAAAADAGRGRSPARTWSSWRRPPLDCLDAAGRLGRAVAGRRWRPDAVDHRRRQHEGRRSSRGPTRSACPFVGGHPMAGRETTGYAAATPTCSSAGRGSSSRARHASAGDVERGRVAGAACGAGRSGWTPRPTTPRWRRSATCRWSLSAALVEAVAGTAGAPRPARPAPPWRPAAGAT